MLNLKIVAYYIPPSLRYAFTLLLAAARLLARVGLGGRGRILPVLLSESLRLQRQRTQCASYEAHVSDL